MVRVVRPVPDLPSVPVDKQTSKSYLYDQARFLFKMKAASILMLHACINILYPYQLYLEHEKNKLPTGGPSDPLSPGGPVSPIAP